MVVTTKIGFYNFWLFIPYLSIRYKVFIYKDKKRISTFDRKDIWANHYILLHNRRAIGTARVIYKKHTAQIGRLSIIEEYRGQGYGKEFMNQLLNLIRNANKIKLVTLLVLKPNLVNFYSMLGFKKDGIVHLRHNSFIQMSKSLY